MRVSNIEPLARAIAERICWRSGMPDAEIPAWVDRHWECAAAELEAGLIDEEGNRWAGDWERGLVAYRERKGLRPL